MSCGYERELQWRRWQGLRIVRLSAFPGEIDPRLMGNLISDCIYRGVSLQLCAEAAGGAMHMYVLLRSGDVSQEQLKQNLDDAARQMEALLTGAGLRIDDPAAEMEELEKRMLPCSAQTAALYHVPENATELYVPAEMGKIMPIDWQAVSRALCGAKNAMFCVHLMPASYTPAEKRVLEDNCRFFEERSRSGASEELQKCESVYRRLLQNAGEQQLFLAVSMHGDAEAEREMASLMNRIGLTRLALSPWDVGACKDWLNLSFDLARILTRSGHSYSRQLSPMLSRFSHIIEKNMASVFAALPRRSSDLSGVHIHTKPSSTQPLPEEMLRDDGILVGERENQQVFVPAKWMPLHAMIVGMPGMGKTTFAVGLLERLWRKGYPFLIIEPTKTEYRRLLDCIPDLQIYTAGRSDLAPVSINPFLPPRGITLEQFKPSLISVFMAAFSMTSPLDVIFPDVVNECYTRYGWRNNSTRDSEGVKVFGLHEFICVFRDSVRRSHYDSESKANLESGGVYRLQALLNSNPMLFDTDNTLPYERLLEKPTLIELDAIDNPEQKSLIMSILLINLMLTIRNTQGTDGRFKNAVMIDEAHLLLGEQMGAANEESAKSSQSAVQLLKNLVVTIRAYGTGLIFADQSPEKLTHEIVSNCNFKTIFHLDSARDRNMLANDTGLTEEMIQDIRALQPGEAYISCSKLRLPVRVQTPNSGAELKLRDYVSDDVLHENFVGKIKREKPFAACHKCGCNADGCDYACRNEGEFLARSICSKVAEALQDADGIRSVLENLDDLAEAAIGELSSCCVNAETLRRCTAMQTRRRIQLISHVAYPWQD